LTWFWKTNNKAEQTGACDSNLDAWTDADECAAGTTCGTATLAGDSSYSVLGCYADADCEALAGDIPDTTDGTFTLLCGSTGLFASTLAAIGVFSTM